MIKSFSLSRENAQLVPEFPSKLDWLNTAPLQFRRVLLFLLSVLILIWWKHLCSLDF